MLEIQQRLARLGFALLADEAGVYGTATRAAVEAFQHRRGLRVDGECGPQTWDILVEAGHHLGDRTLALVDPMLRGDDVAELQQRLSALGFDSGRVDGIFGPNSAAAVTEFQRNAGFRDTGVADRGTVQALLRVQTRQPAPEPISAVRAREALRHSPPTLAGWHVALACSRDLSSALEALQTRLSGAGARVTPLADGDDSARAQAANAAGADVGLALVTALRAGSTTAFYSGYRFESPGGRRLAELVQSSLPPALSIPDLGVQGMSVPFLRETRMTAVIVELGPPPFVVPRAPQLVEALTEAFARWVGAPCD